jgi:hypothetical protein
VGGFESGPGLTPPERHAKKPRCGRPSRRRSSGRGPEAPAANLSSEGRVGSLMGPLSPGALACVHHALREEELSSQYALD